MAVHLHWSTYRQTGTIHSIFVCPLPCRLLGVMLVLLQDECADIRVGCATHTARWLAVADSTLLSTAPHNGDLHYNIAIHAVGTRTMLYGLSRHMEHLWAVTSHGVLYGLSHHMECYMGCRMALHT